MRELRSWAIGGATRSPGAEVSSGGPAPLWAGRGRGEGARWGGALGDWRADALAGVRSRIREADPDVVEEWKWRGVPVWSHAGIICTGETYKNIVKMTFARGAALEDPSGLFNSSLEGSTRRAIDFHDGDKIDEKALKALIRAAAALNTSLQAASRPVRARKTPVEKKRSRDRLAKD